MRLPWEMERIDVAVVGAGVSGLAAARAVARGGRSVCLLERHRRPGLDTCTHNSGVIHAGIDSPGLMSSLATGELIARLIADA